MKRMILAAAVACACATPAFADAFIHFDFGPPPPHGSFWEGAPPTLPERIRIVEVRMERLHNEGIINNGEFAGDHEELHRISILSQELPKLEGGDLTPREHNWLWARLNNLANRLHWQSQLGY